MERAARQDPVAAIDAERRKEIHSRDRVAGTKFVPFALETYDALCCHIIMDRVPIWSLIE